MLRRDTGAVGVFEPVSWGGYWPNQGWFFGEMENDHYLATSFATAAHTLVTQALNEERTAPPLLPIISCYRHALELVLKAGVRESASLLRRDGRTDASLDAKEVEHWLRRGAGHSLHSLAQRLQQHLNDLDLGELPAETHAVLQELHQLDPAGDAFRYAWGWDKATRSTQRSPRPSTRLVDLAAMDGHFHRTFDLLSGGVMTALDVYADFQNERDQDLQDQRQAWT